MIGEYKLPTGDRLTPRQIQILKLVGKGMSNKEIACFLRISKSTVDHSLHRAYERLGATNKIDALNKLASISKIKLYAKRPRMRGEP